MIHRTSQQVLRAATNSNSSSSSSSVSAEFEIDYPTKNQIFSSKFNTVKGVLNLDFAEAATIDTIDIGFKGDVRSRNQFTTFEYSEHEFKIRMDVLFHYAKRIFEHANKVVPAGFTTFVPFEYTFPTDIVDLPSSCDSLGSREKSMGNITVRYEVFVRIRFHTKRFTQVKVVDYLVPLKFQGSVTNNATSVSPLNKRLSETTAGLDTWTKPDEIIGSAPLKTSETISGTDSYYKPSLCPVKFEEDDIYTDASSVLSTDDSGSVSSFPLDELSFSGDHILSSPLSSESDSSPPTSSYCKSSSTACSSTYSLSIPSSSVYDLKPVLLSSNNFRVPSFSAYEREAPSLNISHIVDDYQARIAAYSTLSMSQVWSPYEPVDDNIATESSIPDDFVKVERSSTFCAKMKQYLPCLEVDGLVKNPCSNRPLSNVFGKSSTYTLSRDVTLKIELTFPRQINVSSFRISDIPVTIKCPNSFNLYDLNYKGMTTKLGDFQIDRIQVDLRQNLNIMQFEETVSVPLYTEIFNNKPSFDINDFAYDSKRRCFCLTTTLGEFITDSRPLLEMISSPIMPSISLPDSIFTCSQSSLRVYIKISTKLQNNISYSKVYKFKSNTQVNCYIDEDDSQYYKKVNGASNKCRAFTYRRKFSFNSESERSNPRRYTGAHIMTLKPRHVFNMGNKFGRAVVYSNLLFGEKDILSHQCDLQDYTNSVTTLNLSSYSENANNYSNFNRMTISYLEPNQEYPSSSDYCLVDADGNNRNNENPPDSLYPCILTKRSTAGKVGASRCNYYCEFCYDVGDSYNTNLTGDFGCINHGNTNGTIVRVGTKASVTGNVGLPLPGGKIKKDGNDDDLGGSLGFKL